MSYFLAQIGLSSLLHLAQNHGRDFFGGESLLASGCHYFDVRLGILLEHCEWEVLDVMLYVSIAPLSANKSLGVEDCVFWIGGELILCGISDKTFALGCECYV